MNNQQNMDERLWDYIDGAGNADERLFIEQLIAENAEWRTKYEELMDVHALLGNHLELDEPSLRFTQNVMEEIGKLHIAPAAKSYINKRIIWGIGSFFMLSILGFFIYALGQINWAESTGGNSVIDFTKVNFNKLNLSILTNNTYSTIFMMVNVVLGLVVLDMYLGNKKRQRGIKA